MPLGQGGSQAQDPVPGIGLLLFFAIRRGPQILQVHFPVTPGFASRLLEISLHVGNDQVVPPETRDLVFVRIQPVGPLVDFPIVQLDDHRVGGVVGLDHAPGGYGHPG